MTLVERLKVLVIDDSASNRRTIGALLESAPDLEVVGHAGDGELGLKLAMTLRPDVITLDLEMPKLDGFAFLRLLSRNAPTPVIVVSSYAHRTDVFRALELGALDFVAKPGRGEELALVRDELLEKVRTARHVRPAPVVARGSARAPVVAIGASTGGPAAIQALVESLGGSGGCLLIAQHMPAGFTAAFAERLNRIGTFLVKEARSGDRISPGRAFVAPGGRQLVIARDGERLRLKTLAPAPGDRHAPSVDRLFESVADALGELSVAVVLSGMGADGAFGARRIRAVGGHVFAQSRESALVFGMPKEAIDAGAVTRALPLDELGLELRRLVRARQAST